MPPNRAPKRQPMTRAQQRAKEMLDAQRKAQRRRQLLMGGVAVIAVAAITIAITLVNTNSHKSSANSSQSDAATATVTGPPGPEGVPLQQGTLLAPVSTAATGQTVSGIQCQSNEQVAYHIHTHLAVYVDGALRPLPAGIGIVEPVPQQTAQGAFDSASRCYYWLHVHAQDGIIHVEAPNQSTYTLGQFFAIWRQPLTTNQVATATGTLTVDVNGQRYSGDPASIPLKSHEDVQISVGTPVVPPNKVDWSKTQL